MQLVAVVVKTKEKLSKLAAQMQRFPQVLQNVRVAEKEQWETNSRIQQTIRSGEQQLAGRGRLFVRASGTESLIRVMAEGPDKQELETIVAQVAEAIRQEIG